MSALYCILVDPPVCVVYRGQGVHLLATEDETLLDRGDAFLLLDAFLYPGDLDNRRYSVSGSYFHCMQSQARLQEAGPTSGNECLSGTRVE